jgi:hypothetical protein
MFQTVAALPVTFMPPVPNAIDLTLELVDAKLRTVSVQLPELPVNDNEPNVRTKVLVMVVLAPSARFKTLLFNVVSLAVAVAVVVHVPVPDNESKITSSTLIGAEAPAAPPEVADQLVVDALSHVPVPPTQYLVAIFCPNLV